MKALRSLLLAAACLLVAGPAGAALDADAVVVWGSSWRRVLPTYAAAAKRDPKGGLAEIPPVILWTPGEERWTEELLARLRPRKVVLVAPAGVDASALQVPGKVQRVLGDDASIDDRLARRAFAGRDGVVAKAPVVYVADGVDPAGALAASLLAASDASPLLVADGDLKATAIQAGALARKIDATEVVVVGSGDSAALATAAGRPVRMLSRQEALAAYNGRVASSRHLVVTGPSDLEGPFSPPKLSLGSVPWAIGKRAQLTFAGKGAGEGRSPEQATAALEAVGAGPFDSVSLVGDYLALPMQEMADIDQVFRGVANPRMHKVPAFVDGGGTPSDRAVGRLAAQDVYDLSRWIVRMLHGGKPRRGKDGVLVLANADHKFVLGETISRTTSSELANSGVRVESFYRDQIDQELVRRELPGHSLVLWEGHPRDLTLDDDAMPTPDIPLPPATFFLQGCYTLDRSDPYVLIERGANAVIGTYMAVYSASGSGFAKAWVNAQLHDGATAGEAMAAARNYLLATVELKKRRGHKDWRKTLRAAISFELWGDPTAPLAFEASRPRKAAVRTQLRGNELRITVPKGTLPTARAGAYQADVRPGAVLSSLYDFIDEDKQERRLLELFFVEVDVPEEFGDSPSLTGPPDPTTYAWVFSPRTRKLSLLVHEAALPDPAKGGMLRFQLAAAAEK